MLSHVGSITICCSSVNFHLLVCSEVAKCKSNNILSSCLWKCRKIRVLLFSPPSHPPRNPASLHSVPYQSRPLFSSLGYRPIFPPQCWSVLLEMVYLMALIKSLLTKFVRSRRLDTNQALFARSSISRLRLSPKRHTLGSSLTSHLVNNQYLLTSKLFQSRARSKNVKHKYEQVIRKNLNAAPRLLQKCSISLTKLKVWEFC